MKCPYCNDEELHLYTAEYEEHADKADLTALREENAKLKKKLAYAIDRFEWLENDAAYKPMHWCKDCWPITQRWIDMFKSTLAEIRGEALEGKRE